MNIGMTYTMLQQCMGFTPLTVLLVAVVQIALLCQWCIAMVILMVSQACYSAVTSNLYQSLQLGTLCIACINLTFGSVYHKLYCCFHFAAAIAICHNATVQTSQTAASSLNRHSLRGFESIMYLLCHVISKGSLPSWQLDSEWLGNKQVELEENISHVDRSDHTWPDALRHNHDYTDFLLCAITNYSAIALFSRIKYRKSPNYSATLM